MRITLPIALCLLASTASAQTKPACYNPQANVCENPYVVHVEYGTNGMTLERADAILARERELEPKQWIEKFWTKTLREGGGDAGGGGSAGGSGGE